MKKLKIENSDDLREEYQRSDFQKLERGKYLAQVQAGSNIVVLKPEIAEAFPTSEAVNAALAGLLELATKTVRLAKRSNKAL